MLISMPIGHWVRSYSASCRYQSDTVFYHSAHHLRFMAFVLVYEPYFPAASIRVHRQSSFRIFIKGIASPKLPYELWSETDRAFQAVRPCSLEPAFFFNSYHLDRFGHSVLASLVSLQDISSVTIGLTSFSGIIWRFAIPFQNRKGLRLSCKAPALLPSGVCPFLFCDIIISSTLHNVKCYFSFFHGYIRQRNSVCFSVFPSFQARPDLL